MQTEQINFRASIELVDDIDLVTGLLKISRSEWIKTKLAEEASKEKSRLLMELSGLYARGLVTKEYVQKLVGKEIASQMESSLNTANKSIMAAKQYGRKLKRKVRS